MNSKKTWLQQLTVMLLLLSGHINAEQTDQPGTFNGTLTGEIKNAHILSAFTKTSAPGIKVKVAVAEVLIGSSEDSTAPISVHAGLIKPNDDLIFMNNLEQE